jgi:hypothetical protein
LREQKHSDFKDFLPKIWHFLGKEEKEEGNNLTEYIYIFWKKSAKW